MAITQIKLAPDEVAEIIAVRFGVAKTNVVFEVADDSDERSGTPHWVFSAAKVTLNTPLPAVELGK